MDSDYNELVAILRLQPLDDIVGFRAVNTLLAGELFKKHPAFGINGGQLLVAVTGFYVVAGGEGCPCSEDCQGRELEVCLFDVHLLKKFSSMRNYCFPERELFLCCLFSAVSCWYCFGEKGFQKNMVLSKVEPNRLLEVVAVGQLESARCWNIAADTA